MKTQSKFMDNVKSSYLVVVIAMLGIFAFISAVLIAWPALAYIGSKLFNQRLSTHNQPSCFGERNHRRTAMKNASNVINNVKASYTVAVMSVLGVFAFVSAVLIAWPALAYLGAKMFNQRINQTGSLKSVLEKIIKKAAPVRGRPFLFRSKQSDREGSATHA